MIVLPTSPRCGARWLLAGCLLPLALLSVSPSPGALMAQTTDAERPRARDLGISVGVFPTGTHNAITDVSGVLVGHTTVTDGDRGEHGDHGDSPPSGERLLRTSPRPRWSSATGYGKLVGGDPGAGVGGSSRLRSSSRARSACGRPRMPWSSGLSGWKEWRTCARSTPWSERRTTEGSTTFGVGRSRRLTSYRRSSRRPTAR